MRRRDRVIERALYEERRRLALRKIGARGNVRVSLWVLGRIAEGWPGARPLVTPHGVLGFVAADWSVQHNRFDTRIDHHQDLRDASSLAVTDHGDAARVRLRQRAE